MSSFGSLFVKLYLAQAQKLSARPGQQPLTYFFFALSRFTEFYFAGWLALWLLGGCAAYSAGVLYTASVPEAVAIATHYAQHWLGWSGTPASFERLRLVLASAALALVILGAVATLGLRREGQLAHHRWLAGWRQAGQSLVASWHSLPPQQRHLALGLLAALTVLRAVLSRMLVTFDDSASYEFFVRKSLLTVSADYPAPNNHVLSNTLSWLFYQVYPGYWWSMRVPVLLLSTVATAGWFLGLLRCTNFRITTLTILLFSLLEPSLFYAAEGRGYALMLVLSCVGFFCTMALTAPTGTGHTPGQAWVGLALAGVLGLYTVPTFAYFLVAAYSWLGYCWLRQGAYQRLLSLGLVGATTLLGATLLYVPLGWVSGPGSLLQNSYVKPLSVADFWQQLPAYVWGVEGELMGEEYKGFLASLHIGSLAGGAVLLVFLMLVVLARRGRFQAPTATYVLGLGGPALWFIFLPYTLMLAQRVLAPGRSLLFKAIFMFLLVGIEADWLLRLRPRTRWLQPSLLLMMGLWMGVQFLQLYRSHVVRLTYFTTTHAAAQWLLKQPPGPMLSTSSGADLASIRFFIHFEKPTSALEIDEAPRPGVQYRYLIDPPTAAVRPSSAALPHLHINRGTHSDALDIIARW
jgi:hypothetical protein